MSLAQVPHQRCPTEEQLMDLLRHRLPPERHQPIEEHLDRCLPCQDLLAGLVRADVLNSASRAGPEEAGAPRPGALPLLFGRGMMVDRYVVLETLGSGGMGVVLAAYDPELDRKVALKLLRPDLSERNDAEDAQARLLREARALAQLSHPHIVSVHDAGTYAGQVFVAMELFSGAPLSAWLQAEPRSVAQILDAFLQAGRGLAAAHAQGLVHRDFKPANVLVADDGRVKVLDFGLVQAVATPDDDGPLSASRESAQDPLLTLTTSGRLLGTPAYMAPEQLAGAGTSPATDQFSFCVALYEALYAERPFAGDTLAALTSERRRGRVRPPPRGARVTGHLRQALLRGLQADPALRHPSMSALLGALQRDPRRRLGRALPAAGMLAFLAVSLAAGRHLAQRREQLCRGAERKLVGIWDPGRKRAIEAAILSTGRPYAPIVWRRMAQVLDAHTQGWTAMHEEACAATRLRGEQSDALLDLRMDCLTDRLREVRALADLLAQADGRLVDNAGGLEQGLSRLDLCADREWLAARVRPSVGNRPQVERLRDELARAWALIAADQRTEGAAAGQGLIDRARALGERGTEAEARRLVGIALLPLGKIEQAEQTLHEGVWAAEAAGDSHLLVQILAVLVQANAMLTRHDQAAEWARHADAYLERIGKHEELAARIAQSRGYLLRSQLKYDEASRYLVQAVSLWEKARGPDDPAVVYALNTLAATAYSQHNLPLARGLFERALSIVQRKLGEGHPDSAEALTGLGTILLRQGEEDRAAALARQSLAIRERIDGATSARVMWSLTLMVDIHNALGAYDQALAYGLRMERIADSLKGSVPEYLLALPVMSMAETYLGLKRLDLALECAERVLAINIKTFGAGHMDQAEILPLVGRIRAARGHHDLALRAHRQALAIFEKKLGPQPHIGAEHLFIADALDGIGEAHLAKGEPEQAEAPLARALELQERFGDRPLSLARTRFALARALTEGGDRKRSVALAAAARDTYLGHGKHPEELARVTAWLGRSAR